MPQYLCWLWCVQSRATSLCHAYLWPVPKRCGQCHFGQRHSPADPMGAATPPQGVSGAPNSLPTSSANSAMGPSPPPPLLWPTRKFCVEVAASPPAVWSQDASAMRCTDRMAPPPPPPPLLPAAWNSARCRRSSGVTSCRQATLRLSIFCPPALLLQICKFVHTTTGHPQERRQLWREEAALAEAFTTTSIEKLLVSKQ